MTVTRRPAGVLTLLLLLGVATGAAQGRPQTREGFWIGLGLGGGSLSASTDSGSFDAATGGSGYLRLGGTISPKVLIAGETTTFLGTITETTSGGYDIDVVQGYVGAAIYFYPMEAGGLWLRGGAGYVFGAGDGAGGINFDWSSFGIPLGVGYDIRVGRNISLSPGFVFLYTFAGDLKAESQTVATDFKTTLLALHLGVTFH